MKIFLSAVSRQFRLCRDALASDLRAIGCEVRVQEDFQQGPRSLIEKLELYIAECDRVIALIGDAYGAVASGDAVPLSDPPRSYTQWEYYFAMGERLNGAKADPKDAYVYFASPQFLTENAAHQPLDHARHQQRFVEHVRKSGKDRNAFDTLDQLCRLVLRDGWQLGERPRTAKGSFLPSAWDFSAFLLDKRRRFVGRRWLFEEVEDWVGGSPEQALLIQADYGVGKSAFIAELVNRNPSARVVAYYCCQHDAHETLNPGRFVVSIAAQLAAALPAYARELESDAGASEALSLVSSDAGSAFERAVLAPLSKLQDPVNSPRLLVVDALDESLEFDGAQGRQKCANIVQLLAARTARMPTWLRVLATTRRRPEVAAALRDSYQAKLIDAEDARNVEDVREFVCTRANEQVLRGKLESSDVAVEKFVDALVEKAGGKMLYAVRVTEDLQRGRLDVAEVATLPPGMDGFYVNAFTRRFVDHSYEPVRQLLGVLAVAQEPMTRLDLASVSELKTEQVQKDLSILGDFLRVREGRYSFDHFSLAQWLLGEDDEGNARAGPYAVSASEAREKLRAWGRRALLTGTVHEHRYLLRHLAVHLDETERADAFRHLLQDFRWLRCKLAATDIYSLLADFSYPLSVDKQLAPIYRAMRESIYALGLSNDSSQLSTQLLARLSHLPKLQSLCKEAATEVTRPWLRPLAATLRASSALRAVLEAGAPVTALLTLPDGRLVAGTADGRIRLLKAQSTSWGATLNCPGGAAVERLALTKNACLASGSSDGSTMLWGMRTDQPNLVEQFKDHERPINGLTLLADERLVSSDQYTLVIRDLKGQRSPLTIGVGQTGEIASIAALPDGQLGVGTTIAGIQLWNTDPPRQTGVIGKGANIVTALAVLPRRGLVSARRDGQIQLWHSFTSSHSLFKVSGSVDALVPLPDGRLAAGAANGEVHLLSLDTITGEIQSLRGHKEGVTSLAVTPDGVLVSGSKDKTIRFWNIGRKRSERTAEVPHESAVSGVLTLASGRVVSASHDGTIKLWDPARAKLLKTLDQSDVPVRALAKLPNSKVIALTGEMGNFQIKASGVVGFHVAANLDFCAMPRTGVYGEVGVSPLAIFGEVSGLVVLPDGRVAFAYWDDTIRVLDLQDCTNEVLAHASSTTNTLLALPDGRLVSGDSEGEVRVWDMEKRGLEMDWSRQGCSVETLAYLPDGQLASGFSDGTIELWDFGSSVTTLEGRSAAVTALIPLGRRWLVACARDWSLWLWDLTANPPRPHLGFVADAPITCATANAEEGTIVVGDTSGRLHFLKLEY